jgi:hypothetical protein
MMWRICMPAMLIQSMSHHDFTTESDLQKTYRLEFAYNYANEPKYYQPLREDH